MALKLEIEFILDLDRKGYKSVVFARLIGKENNFHLTENSRLNEVPIEKSTSIPRATDDNGNQRFDLFAFKSKEGYNFNSFNEGQTIELNPSNSIEFLSPWMEMRNAKTLETELNKEIGKNHLLFEKGLEIIGKREDCDDVVCKILDSEKLAVVHLTWSGKEESNSKLPYTEIFDHWTNFYEERVLVDHEDFEE